MATARMRPRTLKAGVQVAEFLLERKKSKFWTNIGHARNAAQARSAVDAFAAQHKKISHHCFAAAFSDGTSLLDDDGEVSGTAARPILGALETHNVVDTVVVVSRKFGGIKLGVGGLKRSYGGAAHSIIKAAVDAGALVDADDA